MLESCVAPILILIVSMFYKKNEQVCDIPPTMWDSARFMYRQGSRIGWFYMAVCSSALACTEANLD